MSSLSILLAAIAILVGSSVFSMVGIGGGVFYVPILLALGMRIHDAATVSLFVIIATSVSAAIVYGKKATIDWKLALLIEPPTAALAFIGGLLANHIDEKILEIILAGVLLVVGFFLIKRPAEKPLGTARGWGYWSRGSGENKYVVRLHGVMPATAAAGFVAGMIGISGGVFKVPAMVILGRVPMRQAIGTSSLMIGITALFGLSGHLAGGSFPVLVALPLAAAALVGGRLGASLSVRTRLPALRTLVAVALFLIAIWLVIATAV